MLPSKPAVDASLAEELATAGAVGVGSFLQRAADGVRHIILASSCATGQLSVWTLLKDVLEDGLPDAYVSIADNNVADHGVIAAVDEADDSFGADDVVWIVDSSKSAANRALVPEHRLTGPAWFEAVGGGYVDGAMGRGELPLRTTGGRLACVWRESSLHPVTHSSDYRPGQRPFALACDDKPDDVMLCYFAGAGPAAAEGEEPLLVYRQVGLSLPVSGGSEAASANLVSIPGAIAAFPFRSGLQTLLSSDNGMGCDMAVLHPAGAGTLAVVWHRNGRALMTLGAVDDRRDGAHLEAVKAALEARFQDPTAQLLSTCLPQSRVLRFMFASFHGGDCAPHDVALLYCDLLLLSRQLRASGTLARRAVLVAVRMLIQRGLAGTYNSSFNTTASVSPALASWEQLSTDDALAACAITLRSTVDDHGHTSLSATDIKELHGVLEQESRQQDNVPRRPQDTMNTIGLFTATGNPTINHQLATNRQAVLLHRLTAAGTVGAAGVEGAAGYDHGPSMPASWSGAVSACLRDPDPDPDAPAPSSSSSLSSRRGLRGRALGALLCPLPQGAGLGVLTAQGVTGKASSEVRASEHMWL
jgi:hypothetical protein